MARKVIYNEQFKHVTLFNGGGKSVLNFEMPLSSLYNCYIVFFFNTINIIFPVHAKAYSYSLIVYCVKVYNYIGVFFLDISVRLKIYLLNRKIFYLWLLFMVTASNKLSTLVLMTYARLLFENTMLFELLVSSSNTYVKM